jgi:UDP-3-O-acyl N-acetylglucosamine deacetylase
MNLEIPQRTLAKEVSLSGKALYSGKEVELRLIPADPDQGIRFIRDDLPGRPETSAHIQNLSEPPSGFHCTALGNGSPLVYPTEHLLGACYGLGLSNLTVILDGPELPFFDGSAKSIVEILRGAGIISQEAMASSLMIREKIEVKGASGEIFIEPSGEGFSLQYYLENPHPQIGRQHYQFFLMSDRFADEIAPARTFCTEQEAEEFLKRGGRGGSTQNCLVFGKAGPLGNVLRFPEEPARHKLLDLLGDLALLGCRLQAKVIARRSGHRLNALLVKKISETAV